MSILIFHLLTVRLSSLLTKLKNFESKYFYRS